MFSKKWGSSSPFVGVARNTLFTYPLSPASQELSLKGEPRAREPKPHKLRLPLEGELPQGFIPEGERGTTLVDI